jgi:hypothetical protein
MPESLTVIGHHGTSLASLPLIESEGFKISQKSWDWLGDGVYFFQDAPERARQWAENRYGDQGVVIAASIDLENCLDLFDIQYVELLRFGYEAIRESYLKAGTPLPKQTAGYRGLDRAVLNFLADWTADTGNTFKTVRGMFIEGEPIYPESYLYSLSHVQIAVRDVTLINVKDILR